MLPATSFDESRRRETGALYAVDVYDADGQFIGGGPCRRRGRSRPCQRRCSRQPETRAAREFRAALPCARARYRAARTRERYGCAGRQRRATPSPSPNRSHLDRRARRRPNGRRPARPSPHRQPNARRGRCTPGSRGKGRRAPDPGPSGRRERLRGGRAAMAAASFNHARARPTLVATTSGRTIPGLLGEASGHRPMHHSRRRRPVPPIDHRVGAEVGPVVRIALQEHPTAACDLEAEQRRGLVERDQIDRSAGDPLERDAKSPPASRSASEAAASEAGGR